MCVGLSGRDRHWLVLPSALLSLCGFHSQGFLAVAGGHCSYVVRSMFSVSVTQIIGHGLKCLLLVHHVLSAESNHSETLETFHTPHHFICVLSKCHPAVGWEKLSPLWPGMERGGPIRADLVPLPDDFSLCRSSRGQLLVLTVLQ